MDFMPMREFSEFCEQLNEIRNRFQKLDSCERTVALYYLMSGLPFGNARFLQHTLEHCISSVLTPDSMTLERNANDPNFIVNLQWERVQNVVPRLLALLPLLRPGNRDAADRYILAIRRVLHELIAIPHARIYNECVELLSFFFVHPAFDKEDKKSFKLLLKQLVNKSNTNGLETFSHSPVNEQSSDESASPNAEATMDRLTRRSNSLTPAQTDSHESLGVWSSQENLSIAPQKPRSYSLSCDHALPLPSLTSSSSDTRLHDMHQQQSISKGIVFWLKSLRLHKYSWVFANLSYDNMIALTDEQLQAAGITKGARHKLLINIAKLKERSSMLSALETEVMNGGDLSAALRKLKTVLQSPLQTTGNEDLPSQFVKVMGKVCTQLLMLRQPADDCLAQFAWLCDRAEALEAFGEEQKRRLALWRGQLSRAGLHAPAPPRNFTGPYNRQHNNGKANYYAINKSQNHQQPYNKSSSYPSVKPTQQNSTHRTSLGNLCQGMSVSPPSSTPISSLVIPVSRPITAVHTSPLPLQTQTSLLTTIPTVSVIASSKSIPVPTLPVSQIRLSSNNNKLKESKIDMTKNTDIESSLENLCLQMMEHALGP